jgi:hypothetical protein
MTNLIAIESAIYDTVAVEGGRDALLVAVREAFNDLARLREIEAAARTLVVEAGLNDALHTEKSHVPVSVERVRKLTSALLDKE